MDQISIQLLAPGLWRWVLLLIPALAVAFWAYYRLLAPLSNPARSVLWILRGMAFFLVVFALWQPVATIRMPERGRPSLAVLLDRSGSMALPGRGDEARSDQLERVGSQISARLGDDYDLQNYRFNDALEPLGRDTLISVGSTSIGQAIEGVLVRAASDPVGGIVIVSDGVNTVGRDPVRIARGSPVPIFTVAVGPEEPLADLELRRVQTNPRAFAGEPLPIKVVISSSGLEGQRVRLEVLEDGQVRETREISIAGDQGLEQEVDLSVRPTQPGLALYEIRAEIDGDTVPQNNLRQVAVEVQERKTRVLCISDAIDWDFGFLRRSFDADTTLGYSYLVRTDGKGYRAYGERKIERLPASAKDLEEFAAVVLVVGEGESIPGNVLDALGAFVRRGGGLFILGSPSNPDAWMRRSAFARVLPARLIPEAGRAPSKAHPVEVTPLGLRHPVTALRENPAETSRMIASLPPIWKPAGRLQPKPSAKPLLRYRVDASQASAAMVVGFGERGKVVWTHGHGLWRWRLTAAGTDLPAYLYSDLVLGIVRWIAEPAIRDRFQAEPGKRVYQTGESSHFTASLWDDAYSPVEGAEISVQIHSSEDSTVVGTPLAEFEMTAGAEPGQYESKGPSLPPGSYRYRAYASGSDSGASLGETEGRFWVEPMGPEFAKTWADREALRQIAGQSDGVYVEEASLAELFTELPDAIRRLGRIREIELWNHWALFALFVLVLSIEWFLRRRRGLA